MDKSGKKICEDLAMLKVVKAMLQHGLDGMTDAELYGIYQDNYDPSEFEYYVNNGIREDL